MSLVDNWIDALPSDALSFLDNVPHIESHSPPPHLHSLPVELHQNVFKFLPPQDIGRLREASEWFASPFGSTLSASKHRLFTIPPAPMHSDMETFHSNFWRVVPIAYHLKVECAEEFLIRLNGNSFYTLPHLHSIVLEFASRGCQTINPPFLREVLLQLLINANRHTLRSITIRSSSSSDLSSFSVNLNLQNMPVLSHLAFHLEVRDVADFISKLPHYSSLESLLFSTTTATDHGLVLLPNDMGLKFSRLRNLTIVGDRRLVHFPISSHPFPSLCHLSVYGLDIDSVSWLISPTLALPNLETLSLSNFWHMDRLVSDSVFPSLKTLVIRPTSTDIRSWLHLVGGGGGGNGLDHPLRKLDLFIHSISRISRIENLEFGGVSNLAPFRHLSSLKSLTFVGDIALMGGFSVLDKMRGLEKLVLLNARIHTLRPLTNLTRLSHVFISHAHIPVESIHPSSLILANLLPNLLYLRLDSCHLDGFTLSMLSGSPRLEELEIVDSEFQSIPDHNSGHTTGEFPLIFTNLKKLDLSGSGLTSLLEWLPIPTSRSKHNLKKLEQLILLDNALMDGFEFIQSSFLPRLKRLEIGVSNGAFLDWEDWASLAHALEILHVRGTSPEHDDDEQGGNDMQSSIGITKVHMINEGILSSFSKLVELRLVAMDLQLSSQWIASIFKSSPLLEVLDLSHNPNLQGPLDQVLDAGHLEELRLANTGALVGDLVVLESSLSTLHTLDLSHNHHMRGFDQLFGCFGRGGSSIKSSDKEPRKHSLLKHLSLANTNLNIEQASLGSSLFNLPHLESLDLSSNGELGSHMVLNLLSLWTIREIDLCGTYLSPYITPFSEREEGEAFVLMKRDARQILQIIFSRYMNQQQQHAASYLAFKG